MNKELVNEIISAIQEREPSIGSSRLVTIDGFAGAGKTTLADQIARSLNGCVIIHLDDLYDGWNDPLGEGLTETFRAQLIPGIASGGSYFLPHYDWESDAPDDPKKYEFGEIVLLEGVGASQSINRPWTALSIWLAIEPEVGLKRVLGRDGTAIEPEMQRFLLRQELHFLKEGSEVVADYRISGAP